MNLSFISKTALFRGCPEKDILNMAKHLDFRIVKYEKGDVILSVGSTVTDIGLVLSGSVRIEHTDLLGNKSILDITSAGGVFAESYACIPNEPMMVDAVANEDCDILFISVPRLFMPCQTCRSQNRLIQNLVMITAEKNLQLSKRSMHISPKTIRGRLFSYFSQQVSAQGSSRITIPFDRQQLADYLNLDRSALSKELGKMKNDGLIEYSKNNFEIKIDIK
ncbi:MAG: Crp/Fnr family transcriptional regulator [Ruminococcus sp.]|nr:Crp/Fnr family transcriptional regulator [Ruminococcus sp.]